MKRKIIKYTGRYRKDKPVRKAYNVGLAILNGTLRTVNSDKLIAGDGTGTLENEPAEVANFGVIGDNSPYSVNSPEGEDNFTEE